LKGGKSVNNLNDFHISVVSQIKNFVSIPIYLAYITIGHIGHCHSCRL
jgi:hypothetical protein